MSYAKKEAEKLYQKYKTTNPFEIADKMGVIIIREEIGSIRGYFTAIRRIRQVHINTTLDYPSQKMVCAHELGHAVMHPSLSTPFFTENTLISKDKFEVQANTFAAELLLPDKLIQYYIPYEYSLEQIAIYNYVDIEICKFKIRNEWQNEHTTEQQENSLRV